MSDLTDTAENDAPPCAGRSARGDCAAPIRYVVATGPARRSACGRHIGWLLGRVLELGETARVTRVIPPRALLAIKEDDK